MEHLSIMRHKSDMRQAREFPGKYGMASLMQALKEAEIKAGYIPFNMNQRQTATKQLKHKGGITTVMVLRDISTKLQHYVYPHNNSVFKP